MRPPLQQISNIKPQIVFIVGATASGKSALAMKVAVACGGEIVCADSQTIRKGLDIGTAKPTAEDQNAVPHHMLDLIEPYEKYSVAEFVRNAQSVIEDIIARKRIPIVVGGSGLYVDALVYDYSFRSSVSAHKREELESMSVEKLQKYIQDSGWALPYNSQNPRHLIRVIETQGASHARLPLRDNAIYIGLERGKEETERRIKQRIELLLEKGFIAEAEAVIQKYGFPPSAIDAIAYGIAYAHRSDDGTYEVEKIKNDLFIAERQYAKRQRSWFKRNPDITWFNSEAQAFEHITAQLKSR